MSNLTGKAVKVIAEAAGLSVADEIAERMAQGIGPAYAGFAAIAGTLPMDLEPATFLVVQNTKAKS
jgi:hypothetical protein